MIDAVLFDLGDTIIDFGVGRREAEILFREGAKLTYDYLHNHRHPNLPPFEKYFKVHYRIMRRAYVWSKISRRDFSYQQVLTQSARKLRLDLSDVDIHHLAQLWYLPISRAATIDPGVRHMLDTLRRAGTKLGIVSNTFVPPHCLDQHLAEGDCWSSSRCVCIRRRCDSASPIRGFLKLRSRRSAHPRAGRCSSAIC
jgi:FMN phosphatase YigB (HAD superfamily)